MKTSPQFALIRQAKCGVCEHNIKGVCEMVKDLHPDKEADISVGVLMPEAWCPMGEWGQYKRTQLNPGERPVCQWCSRYHDKETEICSWCRSKMSMERRNFQKGIGRDRLGVPYDVRLHEVRKRPFTAEPVKHLHYFMYPRFAESTRYHLEQLRKSIDQFNGKRIVCVAVDGNTIESKIKAELGELFTDVYYRPNDPSRRELVGFIDSLKLLETRDENHAICFAHAKGQQEHTKVSEVIRMWSDTGYETCVRNWPEVKQAFEKGYPITGSFKSIGAFRTTSYKWHYSGAFWWGRAAAIFENTHWQHTCNRWWGSESYVGRHWWAEEGHCLFGDNTGGGSLYDFRTWVVLKRDLEQWRRNNEVAASLA